MLEHLENKSSKGIFASKTKSAFCKTCNYFIIFRTLSFQAWHFIFRTLTIEAWHFIYVELSIRECCLYKQTWHMSVVYKQVDKFWIGKEGKMSKRGWLGGQKYQEQLLFSNISAFHSNF